MTADQGARRGWQRRAGLAATPLVVVGVAAGIVLGVPGLRNGQPAASSGAAPVSTAPVVRTDLVNTTQVGGSLGYQGSYTVVSQEQGTAFTQLPALGAVIRRDQQLYEVDGAPVVLFYGARPEWRALAPGVTPGPDVAQLDANLIALGYGAWLTVSAYYTDATAYAVELWQSSRGLPVTGTVPLGQVVYAPGPLRVASVTPSPGSVPQPGGQVLTATSPVPVVIAALPVNQEYLVKTGDHVTVTMPDGVTTTAGVVTSVSQVATAASGSGQGGQADGASPAPAGGAGGGSGGGGQDTVQMTVRLTNPATAGNLDQAPVNVNIVTAQAHGVLAVPVNALVALAGGGYAVDVVQGTGAAAVRHLVAVQTGLFSSTLVQVSAASPGGSGLADGVKVEVPSS